MPQRAGKGRGKCRVVGSRTQQQCHGGGGGALRRHRGGRHHTHARRHGATEQGKALTPARCKRAAAAQPRLYESTRAHTLTPSPIGQLGGPQHSLAAHHGGVVAHGGASEPPTAKRNAHVHARRTRSLTIASRGGRALTGGWASAAGRICQPDGDAGGAGGASLQAGLGYRRQAGRPSQASGALPLRQC